MLSDSCFTGVPPPEQDLADTLLAGAPDASASMLTVAAERASQPLPTATVPSTAASATMAQPALAVQTAPHPASNGLADRPLASGVAHSPDPHMRAPGMFADSSVSVAPAAGEDPASAPFVGLLTSPPLPTAPPAMNATMGGHAMVYSSGHKSCPISDTSLFPQ